MFNCDCLYVVNCLFRVPRFGLRVSGELLTRNPKPATLIVRMEGLEPPRLSAPDPKSGTATNYATCASSTFAVPSYWDCRCKCLRKALISGSLQKGVQIY